MRVAWNLIKGHQTHRLTRFELQYKARNEQLQVWRQRFFEAADIRGLVSGNGVFFPSLPTLCNSGVKEI